MKHEYTSQVMTNQTIIKITCDDCDSNIERRSSYSICYICGKDICRKCIAYDAQPTGDYSEVYCKSCMDIKYKYDPSIKALEDEIDVLYEKMVNECKSNKLLK